MLTAIVLQLQAQQRGAIHGSTGRAVHGFWFQQWQQVDAAFADRLHQSKNPTPFTVSPLMGLPHAKHGITAVSINQQAWLRITTLNKTLSQNLLANWLPRLPAQIELADIPWTVQKIALTPQEHPWAGQARPIDLLNRHTQAKTLPQSWTLKFHTPTTFHGSGSTFLPFPLPDALVGSWLRRWQAFSTYPAAYDLRPRMREALMVSAYDLKTVPVRHGRRLTIGCVGRLTLRAGKLTPDEKTLLATLIDYAFYCGSGYHTAQGMGMTSGN
ncbi:MAG: CRISPR-associated endoribonuclease Cas6 [Anaerolineales bacterium]|nr:CRISPR-associated endoribonuclease Cas6 [Anaerolineales bacterium]